MSDHAILTAALLAFGPAKELARAAGCHLVTAHRYRNGETIPDALTLTRLMSRSRAIADAVLRMAGLDELSLEIEEARLLREVAELREKRARRNDAFRQMAATEMAPLPSVAPSAQRDLPREATAPHHEHRPEVAWKPGDPDRRQKERRLKDAVDAAAPNCAKRKIAFDASKVRYAASVAFEEQKPRRV